MTSTTKPGLLQVKNWAKFQHYHDRNPPWIKLSTDVFQNPEFSSLSGASKLLAICIWTLASKSPDSELGAGSVPDDYTFITRWGFLETRYIKPKHLEELVNKGFLIRPASKSLAKRKQSARAETEAETYKQETETDKSNGRAKDALVTPTLDAFAELWKAWPKHSGGRGETLKKFLLVEKGESQLIVARGLQQVEFWKQEGKETQFIPWLKTWLNQRRFDTEPELEKAGKGNAKTSSLLESIRNSDKSPLRPVLPVEH